MIRALALAVILLAGCGKAKDDSPRGRCERGCARMRTCMQESLGRTDTGAADPTVCVNQCLQVGPPDDARLERMEAAPCSEVIAPGAKVISVPRQEPELEGPIQSPGDNK